MQLYRIYLEKTAPDKAGPSVPEAGGGSLCWPLRENAGGLELLAAVAWRDTPEGAAGRFLAGRGLTGRVTETEEVPPSGVRALWERADEGVRPPWAALDGQLRLDDLRELAASGGAGWLPLDPSLSRQELAARCERELLPDLEAELERIFSRDTPVFLGHPVHYILEDDGLSDVNETAGLEDLLAGIHAPCTRAELRQAFDRWRDGQLRTAVYPDYRDAVPAALAGGPGGSVPY